MCSVKAPKAAPVQEPVFVRNPYLDEVQQDVNSATALRRGRSSLVIPKNTSIGTTGRGSEITAAGFVKEQQNSQNPISGGGTSSQGPGFGNFDNNINIAPNKEPGVRGGRK